MKKNKITLILLGVAFINLVANIIAYFNLPDKIAVHYNAHMVADRLGGKWILFAFSLVALAVSVVQLIIILTKKENNQKLLKIIFSTIIIFLIYISLLILLISLEKTQLGEKIDIPLSFLILAPVGVVIMVISNYLPQIKYVNAENNVSMSNQNRWRKIYRFLGHLGYVVGILIILISIIGAICEWQSESISVILGLIILCITISIIYFIYVTIKEKSNIVKDNSNKQDDDNKKI